MSKAEGDRGEALVAQYLRKNGYRILAHSYRCRFGEIDLVAEKDDVISFVEVKLRSSTAHGLPREFVTYSKQRKLRRTAECYLAGLGREEKTRFDVAEVYTDSAHTEATARIEYLEDAF